MRGGVLVYIFKPAPLLSGSYSPHAWGCFLSRECSNLDDTYGIPHMRGGVSLIKQTSSHESKVFPTCVGGVSGVMVLAKARFRSIPHMRGGVSALEKILTQSVEYSPHAWGCFFYERFTRT